MNRKIKKKPTISTHWKACLILSFFAISYACASELCFICWSKSDTNNWLSKLYRLFSFAHWDVLKSKSNLSLYSLYYAEACNEFAGPISASLRPGNTAPFEEMSQRWRAVGNTVSDLTGPRFEPRTSRSRDERVTARPTGRFLRCSHDN